ncbi:MAG: SDR family NAD(P)-dependent oxidoreductase [Phycisphaerales bacterium]|nr:SDR family NAD(P)-dependent oxidoreductase [Phycisphaerales bacterium]
MSKDLTGRVILITGASSGIGRVTALACAKAGMDVAISARREDKLDSLAGEIRVLGRRAFAFPCDVTSREDQDRFVAETLSSLGRLDAVFANAGYGIELPIADHSDASMRDIFEVNFFGTLNTIHAALPILREQHHGHILICSSCVARIPLPRYGAYSATKAAQHHIGRALRLELEPDGIDVTTVHPVGTTTEFFSVAEQKSKAHGMDRMTAHAPRWATQRAERVADAIVRCLRRPRPELWMSRTVHFGAAVLTLFPRIADVSLRGTARRGVS